MWIRAVTLGARSGKLERNASRGTAAIDRIPCVSACFSEGCPMLPGSRRTAVSAINKMRMGGESRRRCDYDTGLGSCRLTTPTRSSNVGSRPRQYCPRPRPQPRCSGRCLPRVRSPCRAGTSLLPSRGLSQRARTGHSCQIRADAATSDFARGHRRSAPPAAQPLRQ